MRIDEVLIKNTVSGIATHEKAGETMPGILVPVNASSSAFHSLEYALHIARVLHTSIHLFHVTDARELPESGNPIVVNRILERLDRKAANCVASLKEIIEESGVKVHTAESVVGNVEQLLYKRMAELSPTLIILGRDSFSKHLLSRMISHAAYPILVIPESVPPRLPSSIILSYDQSELPAKKLDVLFKLVQRTTQELTVLSIAKRKHQGKQRVQRYQVEPNSSFLVNYYQTEEPADGHGIEIFVSTNEVDLICTLRQKRAFLDRIFDRNAPLDLIYHVSIPVLVL
jgi:nucleotide-binding universal stress UspA family protein